ALPGAANPAGSGVRCSDRRVHRLEAPGQYPAPAERHRESLREARRRAPVGPGGPLTRVTVLGAGSWGTTLADLLTRKGHEVRIWAYETDVAAAINGQHENPVFLPGCGLAPALRAETDAEMATRGAEFLVTVAPSHVLRRVVAAARAALAAGAIVISATKGIEPESLALMSEVLRSTLPGHPVCALSGPSFALEVYQGQPTAVVAAAEEESAARAAQ